MKKLITTAIVIIAVTGCQRKETTGPETDDQSAISGLVNGQYSGFFGIFDGMEDWGGAEVMSTPDTLGGIVNWGREIDTHTIDVNIVIHNDTANVTVTHDVKGILHIQSFYPDTAIHIQKPLHHIGYKYALFVREGSIHDPHRGWVLKKISNGEATSQDTNTINVLSIRVVGGGYDTTITDPLVLQDKENVFKFSPGETVTVYMEVDNPSCIPVLHPRPWHRRLMEPTGTPGLYVGVYRIPFEPGVYHAVFDALRWECIMGSTYPYEDANLWFMTYRVE